MTFSPQPKFRHAWLFLLPVLLGARLSPAPSPGLDLEAQLIWVTDRAQPPSSKYKPVEPAIAERLSHLPFKWKHFYEVNRRAFSVAQTETRRVQLSAPCRLEVKRPGPSRVEVNLYGQNRLVNTIKQPLARGEILIIGGDGKRADAWLVILRAVPPGKVLIQTSVK